MLLVLLWAVGFVRASAVSRLASSSVFVGGLELRLLGGEENLSVSGADELEESKLPMKVQRFFLGGVVAAASAALALTAISAASALLSASDSLLFP